MSSLHIPLTDTVKAACDLTVTEPVQGPGTVPVGLFSSSDLGVNTQLEKWCLGERDMEASHLTSW